MDCMRLWGDGRQSGNEFDFPKRRDRKSLTIRMTCTSLQEIDARNREISSFFEKP